MGGRVRGNQEAAISHPGTKDLTNFPKAEGLEGVVYFRVSEHPCPWWFNSGKGAERQRFDLPAPHGTCYLGKSVETAIREKARERLLSTGTIPLQLIYPWMVYDVMLPSAITAADTSHKEAVDYGANRELATVRDLETSCAWAGALFKAGFEGIVYASRFTSEQGWNAIALFGLAGERTAWPIERKRSALEAMETSSLGHMVSGRRGLRIVPPPKQ